MRPAVRGRQRRLFVRDGRFGHDRLLRHGSPGTAGSSSWWTTSNISAADHRSMPEVSGGGGDIFQQAGQLLSPDGYVVYPQAEGDFNATIPDSTSTVSLFARADLAPEGQLLSSLSVGIDALSTIAGAFEGKVALSQRAEILKTLLEVESCRESTNAEQLVANCLTVHELTGSFGDMLGAILAPVVTISGLVTYFRGALNGIFDQFNNRSKFVVAVQRAPTAAQAPYQVWIDPDPGAAERGNARLQTGERRTGR